jgi:hypothetical protein
MEDAVSGVVVGPRWFFDLVKRMTWAWSSCGIILTEDKRKTRSMIIG